MLKVAVLIISTTAAQDPSTDASGAVLRDVLEQEGGGKWELVDTKIVPDEVVQIQRQIMSWADAAGGQDINLILTTGGTGFATADHTPEVTYCACILVPSAFGGIDVVYLHRRFRHSSTSRRLGWSMAC